jgi:transcriptional regulator with XRE-family HTH domain
MDHALLARQLLVAWRGRRSQVAWSRRLGYRSNVAYAWESGRRSPTAAEALRAAQRAGVDVGGALARFWGASPDWLVALDPSLPRGVARLMEELRGGATITELCRRTGISRYALSRWLSGETEPKLPDFLAYVDAASLRLVDLVAALADPAAVPVVAGHWARLEARRRGAYERPWTQAVLRALELEGYRDLPRHRPGWIAARLGIEEEEEEACIEVMAQAGQVTWTGTHFRAEGLAVDTRAHPEIGRRLKAHWTRVAADRIEAQAPGQFSYNVFAVSDTDFEKIRELQRSFFEGMRAVVAASDGADRVCVVNVQLFGLDGAALRRPDGPPR